MKTIIVVLTFFTFLWAFYNQCIRPKRHFMGECVLDLPPIIPMIKDNKLVKEKCLDGWSFGHLLIYITAGYFSPNKYKLIFLFSLATELLENYYDIRARTSDLFMNLFGYFIGSYYSNPQKLDVDNWLITIVALVSYNSLMKTKDIY